MFIFWGVSDTQGCILFSGRSEEWEKIKKEDEFSI